VDEVLGISSRGRIRPMVAGFSLLINMENFEFQKYRDNLAKEIKQEPDKEKRREIFLQIKTTDKYQEARRLKMEKVNSFVEDQEKISSIQEQMGVEHKGIEITTTRQAVRELENLQVDRPSYSIEDSHRENPLMHYSKAGNIFQILRFGIQSNNFKNRFDTLRKDKPEAEKLATQMCGLRIKQGGSYQEPDSISLSEYSKELPVPPNNILYLINPSIKTFGGDDGERDTTSGYGHGIKTQVVAEEYRVGNRMAYANEILGANAIMPKELRAIVVDKYTSILRDMGLVTQENAKVFLQEKNRNPRASEDLVATAKLLAELVGNESIASEAQELEKQLTTMSYTEICSKLIGLQKKALAEFIGADKKMDEVSLREAIENKFNIHFISK